MIGARIRQARVKAGMTQKEVAAALNAAGIAIKTNQVGKFEHDRDMPNAQTLMELSRLFAVPPVWLMYEPGPEIKWLAYRKRSTLTAKTRQAIEGYARDVAELQIELRVQICPDVTVNLPEQIPVWDDTGAEEAAGILRQAWNLGDGPIASLTRTAEENGVVVVDWNCDSKGFDGLSGWYGDDVPVVVIKGDVSADRKRFSLAHELGHLVMQTPVDMPDKQTEKLAHRFAGALLVSAEVARREFRELGSRVGFTRLDMLKQKYGLSMQGWVYRAKDLGLISSGFAQSFWQDLNQHGFKRQEPFDFVADEKPVLLEQMIVTAMEKGLISPYKVLQAIPDFDFSRMETETDVFPTATELMEMPKEQRNRLTAVSFALAAKEDFERFEAFG